LSIDGGDERTIEEEKDSKSAYGYDPLVVSIVFPDFGFGSGGTLRELATPSAATVVTGMLFAEVAIGYGETSTGFPTYSDEALWLAVPPKAGTYDVADSNESSVTYFSIERGLHSSYAATPGSGTITVSELGKEGKVVEGEFDLTVFNVVDASASIGLTGTFKVKREENDFDPLCQASTDSGTTHYIETLPDNTGVGIDTVIFVYDANQDLVCMGDFGGYGGLTRITLDLSSGKKYFLKVAGYTGEEIGPYSVRVSTTGFADAFSSGGGTAGSEPDNDDASGAEALTVDGATLDRELDANDFDWYKFTAK
jgi:hypothetical protein